MADSLTMDGRKSQRSRWWLTVGLLVLAWLSQSVSAKAIEVFIDGTAMTWTVPDDAPAQEELVDYLVRCDLLKALSFLPSAILVGMMVWLSRGTRGLSWVLSLAAMSWIACEMIDAIIVLVRYPGFFSSHLEKLPWTTLREYKNRLKCGNPWLFGTLSGLMILWNSKQKDAA